jgi:pre-mRNA-splicing factor CWC22
MKNVPKESKKRNEKEKVVNSDELKDDNTSNEEADQPPPVPVAARKNRDVVTGGPSGGRTGGVYVPPFKLAMMMKAMGAQDKSTEENQKLSWEALRKSINGLINKVNVANMKDIIPELFQENLVRGRGLFARAIMKAQLASPGFTHIYSALLAIVNTKLPENGELVLKRVIYGFKRAYKRRDKITATALSKFIAHLVNHQIAHEILSLQLLTVLLEEPTDDSVEIAVNFVKEVGQLLEELSPQGLHAIFERFRGILHHHHHLHRHHQYH